MTKLDKTTNETFDKKFPSEKSAYINNKNEYVYLFYPAVDSRKIKQFIATQKAKSYEEGFNDAMGNTNPTPL